MSNTPSYISLDIEIRNSKIHGRGMFAKKDISRNSVVFKWGGTFVSESELPKDKNKYIIIQVDDDLYSIEPKISPEDDTYFINHSCNPNVWMSNGITFVALRDIKKGEELTVDYALFVSEDYVSKWACKCGARDCRKKITGLDYKILELQRKYKGHFSPVIQKKIILNYKQLQIYS